MKIMVLKLFGEGVAEEFKASKNWLCHFVKNHNLRLHWRTNKKNVSVEDHISKIKQWHACFHHRIKHLYHTFVHHQMLPIQVRLNAEASYNAGVLHPKWGRFLPRNQLRVDQVPCNLFEGSQKTYSKKRSKGIWIAGTKADSGKSFHTLQICARADPDTSVGRENNFGQPKISVIFRGTSQ